MNATAVQQAKGEHDLYSSAFAEVERSSLSEQGRRAILYLERRPDVTSVYRVARGDRHGKAQVLVGVSVDLGRYLPPRCDPRDEGMLPVEPTVFLFDEAGYGTAAPRVGSDRKDFSWDGKPHISRASERWPPLFCLARAPMDDWFAEHGFAAFFDRVAAWLDDAAQGKLQREEGRFEPTVVPPGINCLFEYDRVAAWMQNRRGLEGRPGYYFGQFVLLGNEHPHGQRHSRFAVKYDNPLDFKFAARHVRKKNTNEHGRALGGVLTWTPDGTIVDSYFTTLPSTRGELYAWADEMGISLKVPLERLVAEHDEASNGDSVLIPILVAIQRPNRLFGVESDVELLPLVLSRNKQTGKETVFPMRHQHLLTAERAQEISNTRALSVPVTLVGAGALGSKLFAHWYRGGHTQWTLIDHDIMAAHNLVRHVLQPSALGRPKVEGLQAALEHMFESEESHDVEVIDTNLQAALDDEASRSRIEGSFVIDATASQAAMRRFTSERFPFVHGMARCTIVDEGRKAILMLEGADRNPRVDDLRAYLYHLGIRNDAVSAWLTRRVERRDELTGLVGEEVEIGLGCASETFRLADDEVSLHAAQLSMRLRHWLGVHSGPCVSTATSSEKEGRGGRIGISSASSGWCEWTVPPVEIAWSEGWQVRVAPSAVAAMRALMCEFAPDETGGIALGRVDFNERIVYVTGALPPPPDSRHSPSQFVRGKKSVRAEHERAMRRTGSTIGYAVEWHTHPRGPRALSGRDLRAARQACRRFRGSTFPAVLLVMTPSGFTAHVEDPLGDKQR
jgi:proteasome lid subunit RPN8/RPN11